MTTYGDTAAAERESDWYQRWFGEEYLQLYPHRDREEARAAAELVLGSSGGRAGQRTLDLACGAGRHLAVLRELGARAVGLDLSLPLLRRAAAEGLPVVQGDMRVLPFRGGTLELVTSFFTSFGYFDDPRDDVEVLREIARVLRTDGTFALDYLNANRVRAELRARDEKEVGERMVVETRRLVDGGHVVEKSIEIWDPGADRPRSFVERVRLYDAEELIRLLDESGLEVRTSFGDYAGGACTGSSPRVILLARRC